MMSFSKHEPALIEVSRRKDIISIYGSVNESRLSLKDQLAQKAKAYICTFRKDQNQYDIGVFFDFLGTQPNAQFVSSLPITQESLAQSETQALDFVERLGFMMANLEIGKLNFEEREKYFSLLPLFEKDKIEKSKGDVAPQTPKKLNAEFEEIKKEMFVSPMLEEFNEHERTELLSPQDQKVAQKFLLGF